MIIILTFYSDKQQKQKHEKKLAQQLFSSDFSHDILRDKLPLITLSFNSPSNS